MVSPDHQSTNEKAKGAVQIVQRRRLKCKDKYLAFLDFKTTPLENVKASRSQLASHRQKTEESEDYHSKRVLQTILENARNSEVLPRPNSKTTTRSSGSTTGLTST